VRVGVVAFGVAGLMTLGGCGGGGAGGGETAPTSAAPVSTALTGARAQLSALAAAAKDKTMVAFYTLRSGGRADRTVAVTLATDGTWRVDIPGGALGGTVDIAVAAAANGLYQCTLPTTAQPGGCVRVAGRDGTLAAAIDPRVWRIFTEWRDVLLDRRAALSVAPGRGPDGVTGACYSIESTSASLVAPVDPGIYCYAPDGVLTGAVTGFGTLVLASQPSAAPPTVALPAPVVPGTPLTTAAPPPSPSATPTPP
jgi:hypothetical protein